MLGVRSVDLGDVSIALEQESSSADVTHPSERGPPDRRMVLVSTSCIGTRRTLLQ